MSSISNVESLLRDNRLVSDYLEDVETVLNVLRHQS